MALQTVQVKRQLGPLLLGMPLERHPLLEGLIPFSSPAFLSLSSNMNVKHLFYLSRIILWH